MRDTTDKPRGTVFKAQGDGSSCVNIIFTGGHKRTVPLCDPKRTVPLCAPRPSVRPEKTIIKEGNCEWKK